MRMSAASGSANSTSTWQGGATFEHVADSGVSYLTDALLQGEELRELKGPAPMELLLGGVGGCTGVDLVGMLSKMRLDLKLLRIQVEGERGENHPRIFRKLHILYEIETDPVDARRVQRAVQLSATKYCPASATLARVAQTTYTLRYAGEEYQGVIEGVRTRES